MENFLWSRNKVEARKLIFSKWFFQWVDTQHQGPSVFKSPKEFLLQFCTLKSFSKILFVDKSTKNQYWLQQFFIKLPNPWDEMHRKGYLEFLICQGMIFFINQNSLCFNVIVSPCRNIQPGGMAVIIEIVKIQYFVDFFSKQTNQTIFFLF